MTLERLIPEQGHWSTEEDGIEDCGHSVRDDDSREDPYRNACLPIDEESIVLDQDGELGEGQSQVVDPDRDPERLSAVRLPRLPRRRAELSTYL